MKYAKNCDKFILSKGHAALALYVILAYKKIISKKNLVIVKLDLVRRASVIKLRCRSNGSFGHGLSMASGIALANKIKNKSLTYVLMSDGECNEGAVGKQPCFLNLRD